MRFLTFLCSIWFAQFQALSLAEQERRCLQEKLGGLQNEFESATMEHERQKREWNARSEQQTATISVLQSDVKDLRARIEDASYVNIQLNKCWELAILRISTDSIVFRCHRPNKTQGKRTN